MYQTTIKGDKRFHSLSEGYGAPVELFGYTEDGETPMSLLFRLIPTMKKDISPLPFIYLRI